MNDGHRFGVRIKKRFEISDELLDHVQTEHPVVFHGKVEVVSVKKSAFALVHVGLLGAKIEDLVVVRAVFEVEKCFQIFDLITLEFD